MKKHLRELLRCLYARKLMMQLMKLDREIEIVVREVESVSDRYIRLKKRVIRKRPSEMDERTLFDYACYLTIDKEEREKVLGL